MKHFSVILLFFCMLFSINTIAFASSDVKIKVNGTLLSDAQAILKDGSTLLPVRSVSIALGGEVIWDADTKTASIDKDGTSVAITIGQKEISINGKTKEISTPAQIVSGRTYVPLRALGEALECDITWVNATKTVEITQQDPSEYKLWYEADDTGKLYIRSNIDSKKWGGYSIIIKQTTKDKLDHWDSKRGEGTLQYKERAFITPFEDNSIINYSEFYIFKGKESENIFWTIFEDCQYDLNKTLSLMTDTFVCRFKLDNDILIKETNEKINLTDLNLAVDKTNSLERCSVSILENTSKNGEYSLELDVHRGHPERTYSVLKTDGNILHNTHDQHFFTCPGTKGTFFVVHSIYSMDDTGTITLSRTVSNGIDYTFPLY